MRPPALYDTELAGRLAGFDRVNLAAMVAAAAGFRVGQGPRRGRLVQAPAARRSGSTTRPWMWNCLIELREAIADVLAEQGKTDWAAQEFDYLRTFGSERPPPPARRDRWRRTSGIHRVRDQRGLAAVRELWTTRDRIAQRRDIAPRRILPDSAIIDAAIADPKTRRGPRSRCRCSVGATNVAAPRCGWRRWKQPGKTRIRRRRSSRRTGRRRRRGGAGGNRRPPHGWRRRERRWRKCRSGSGFRPRT